MITEVNGNNLFDAAKVYMYSWKESHKDICSLEFIEKHDLDYMINFLSEKIEKGYLLFIDYINKKPVGIIAVNLCDEEICLLYVLPEEEGNGYGSELLSHAVSICKNPYITVLDTNIKAIGFYRKRGFVPEEDPPEKNKEKRIFERKYIYQR